MSGRIMVVADNRSLSLGLAGQEFEVVDLRPDQLTESAISDEAPDLVVVGIERTDDAMAVLATCRDKHADVPVLIVGSNDAGLVALGRPEDTRVEVLQLPVSRASLVAAVQRLIPSAEQPPAETPDEVPAEPPIAPLAPGAGEAVQHAAAHRIVAARSTDALRERLAAHRTDHDHNGGVIAPPEGRAPESTAGTAATGAAAQAPYAQWDELRRHGSAQRDTRARAEGQDTGALVERLLGRLDELVDVRDAADALAAEATTLAGAGHAAVLLPDGDLWRVCGSSALRPLELRYVVEADSWLGDTVIHGLRGVIIEDSDIARQRLGGAPLAHHRHLMAAPIPAADGLIILARDEDAFGELDLGAVANACADAGPLLADALRVRALARGLADFSDLQP